MKTFLSDGDGMNSSKSLTICRRPLGFGLHWEADAVARSLRDGEKENPRMPHVETLLEMKVRLP